MIKPFQNTVFTSIEKWKFKFALNILQCMQNDNNNFLLLSNLWIKKQRTWLWNDNENISLAIIIYNYECDDIWCYATMQSPMQIKSYENLIAVGENMLMSRLSQRFELLFKIV